MIDIGWGNIAVVAAVALLVIKPEDIPATLRAVGKFVAKAKSMAREFQSNVDDMIRETEIDEVRKQIQSFQSGSIGSEIEKTVDPTGELTKAFEPPEFSLEDKSDKSDPPPPVDMATPVVAPTPLAAPQPAERPAA